MVNLVVLSLVILFSGGSSAQFSEYDPHYADKLSKALSTESGFNFYTKSCTYDRQCDESFGYICRDGRCTCKFGRPDYSDAFKCKVQVKLGDFCKELSPSSRTRGAARSLVYVRRKCPHNSECAENTSGICECVPLFRRQGTDCIPKILNAGHKSCRSHQDCMVQRGQQCYNGSCVECGVGRFKNFRPMAKWVVARPECTCFDKLTELQENVTRSATIRHQKHTSGLKPGSCNPPVSVGDHCTISQNCVTSWTPQLVCEDGTCSCPPGSRMFQSLPSHPLSTLCILPINSACSSDKDCHGPTAYCESRLEVPVCKCRDGYELEKTAGSKNRFFCSSRFHEEVCGKFFPQGDKLRDQLEEQRLSCIQGIYECARPAEMYWDGDRGKCVSLVGGRCDLNLFDRSGCAGNSRCWEYKGLGEFRCQCPLQGEREEDENTVFSDIHHKQGQGRGLTRSSGVRYKPARDRRSCVRLDV